MPELTDEVREDIAKLAADAKFAGIYTHILLGVEAGIRHLNEHHDAHLSIDDGVAVRLRRVDGVIGMVLVAAEVEGAGLALADEAFDEELASKDRNRC